MRYSVAPRGLNAGANIGVLKNIPKQIAYKFTFIAKCLILCLTRHQNPLTFN
jgi:hypothetical protein